MKYHRIIEGIGGKRGLLLMAVVLVTTPVHAGICGSKPAEPRTITVAPAPASRTYHLQTNNPDTVLFTEDVMPAASGERVAKRLGVTLQPLYPSTITLPTSTEDQKEN
jgi:hypothetical protein